MVRSEGQQLALTMFVISHSRKRLIEKKTVIYYLQPVTGSF